MSLARHGVGSESVAGLQPEDFLQSVFYQQGGLWPQWMMSRSIAGIWLRMGYRTHRTSVRLVPGHPSHGIFALSCFTDGTVATALEM